jgi:hypothetical protein
MSKLWWQFIFKRIGLVVYFLLIFVLIIGILYYSSKMFPRSVGNYSEYCQKQYMNLSGFYQTGYGVELNCTDSTGKIHLFHMKNLMVVS